MADKLIDFIKDELALRGWSQRELARRANISHAAISNVLSRNSKPGIKFCSGMANVFLIPEEEIYQMAGIMTTPSKGEMSRQMQDMFEQLNEESKRWALEYVELMVKAQ